MTYRFFLVWLTSELFIGCSTLPTQPKPPFQTDFKLFTQILKQAHAGLNKYHSTTQVDSVFAYYQRQITDSTDVVTLYNYLTAATTYLGSLHDAVSLPDTLRDRLARQAVFFPYPVRLLGDSLVCDAQKSLIPAGAVIETINQIPVAQILPQLAHYYTTDGYNQTGKQIGINQKFSWYFRLAYGPHHSFRVVYHQCGQSTRHQVKLAAKSFTAVNQQIRYNPFTPLAALPDYSFKLIDSQSIAFLTVNTFEFRGEQEASHARYVHFLDSCFHLLRQRQVTHLVIDIRQNGGGDDPNDLVTFSYLAHRPFRENKTAFTLFQKVPFPQYYVEEERGERAELESELSSEFTHHRQGRYYQAAYYNPLWHPNRLAFRGKLYLLVGPAVASAASLFASLVASERQAVIIGQETMGGYYGHTGHKSVLYQLPKSNIRVRFSIVDLQQAVYAQDRIAYGRGIIPTQIVAQGCQDYLRRRDAELQAALRLIQIDQPVALRQVVR